MTVVVTGANGFVGSKLVDALTGQGRPVRACLRQARQPTYRNSELVGIYNVDGLSAHTAWEPALAGANVVVHTAAKVHDMKAGDSYEPFRHVNVDGTANLAEQAVRAGVKRFVFVSSLKVHGEMSPEDRPFTADDPANPQDAYGRSKYEAELTLLDIASRSGMELVIVRPPLVYGPGVKANFLAMMKAVNMSVPLPFGALTKNKRSLISVHNLVDFLVCAACHTGTVNDTFLVSDDEYLSTAELLRKMADALDKRLYSIPVPPIVLLVGAKLLGKQLAMQRLTSDLAADITKTKRLVGWSPPFSSDMALAETAAHFRNEN